MECFRQLARLVKSPFEKKSRPVLDIGPPTNFRREDPPAFFSDDDAVTLHSHGSMPEKDEKVAMLLSSPLKREPSSTRDKIRTHVRRLSVRSAQQPLPDDI